MLVHRLKPFAPASKQYPYQAAPKVTACVICYFQANLTLPADCTAKILHHGSRSLLLKGSLILSNLKALKWLVIYLSLSRWEHKPNLSMMLLMPKQPCNMPSLRLTGVTQDVGLPQFIR